MRELLGDDDNDDDNDSFYDRTGQAERAELRKIQQSQKVETYESLAKQREELTIKIEETRNRISNAKLFEKSTLVIAEDDLDSYMNTINKDLNCESVTNLEITLQDLLKQDQRLAKLIEITKPLDIMQSNSRASNSDSNATTTNKSLITEQNIKVNVEKNIPIPSSNRFKTPMSINFEEDDVSLAVNKSTDKISQKRQILPDGEEINNEKEKRIKTMIPMTPQEYEKKQRKAEELNELEIEDATAWDPPKGQTGDGRTALNDKYGY